MIAAGLVVGGCFGGNPSRPVTPKHEEEAEKVAPKGINTESGEATRYATEGVRHRRWSVRWTSAEMEYTEDGRVFGSMNAVSGSIFENDKVASDYFGDRAVSKKDSDVLALEGSVKVVSRKPKATLICDRLEWHGELGLVVAKGNVRMESERFQFGRAPEIWCAPDLSRVGTPKEYYARSNMDVRAKLALPLLAVAALGAAQGKRILLGTGEDRFELSNLDGGYSQLVGPSKFEFVGTGSPLKGNWGSQKITFETKRIEGKASEGQQSSIMIDTVKMAGGVDMTAIRPSRVTTAGAEQKIRLQCTSADYARGTDKLTLVGATSITQADEPAKHSLRLSGSGGYVILYPPGQAPQARRAIKEARLEGPVAFTLQSQREVADPIQAGRTVWQPYTVKGKAGRLTYDDAERKMTLIGNVEIDGTSVPWIGDIQTSRIALVFDDLGNPVRVDIDDPGTTTIQNSKPPGRRR